MSLNRFRRLFVVLVFLSSSFGFLHSQTAITGLEAEYSAAIPSTYTEGGTTYDYGVEPSVGANNDLLVLSFTIDLGAGDGTQTFEITNFADRINIVRQDNLAVNAAAGTAEKQLLFFESAGNSSNPIELRPLQIDLMETALLNQVINRGTDNVFSNAGGVNLNNIERIDYIENGGLVVAADSIGDGFIILDRGGNDDLLIAAITSLDGNGDPDEWGPVLKIENDTDWGQSSLSIATDVLASDSPADNLVRTADLAAQAISGVFVSYADLGGITNDIIYGYSLAGGDANQDPVAAEWSDVSDATRFPRNTSAASNDAGGLDLIAGGAIVSRTAFADLAITKTVDDETPTVGDDVTFTLTAFNLGPFTASLVTVSELLPSGYTYVSHSASTGTYVPGTGVWNIGSKLVNNPQTLEIIASVNATGNYVNVSTITSATDDPFPGNNTQQRSVVPTSIPSNLIISKSSNVVGSVNHGDTITYTIEVENTGGTEVTGVDVADLLPAGVTYVGGSISASLDQGGSAPQTLTHRVTDTGSGTYTVPTGVTDLKVELWGGGGSGASSNKFGNGGGGGGGAYARLDALTVTPGQSISYFIGAGGALPGTTGNPGNIGGDSWFAVNTTLLAKGGTGGGNGSLTSGGVGGAASGSIGDHTYSGGDGGNGLATGASAARAGGGGGGSAFSNADGGDGLGGSGNNPGDGGLGEGNGGDGGQAGRIAAQAGLVPGGGGGGCGSAGAGVGAGGELLITYTIPGTNGTSSDPSGTIASGWTLLPGATLTVTFDVILDSDTVLPEIINAATFTSDDDPSPIGDSVTDPVNGATLESFVWHDLDADGLQGIGEPGLFNVTVNLLDGSGSPVLNPLGSPVSANTNLNGEVSFAGLPLGDYILEFAPASLPAAYVLSPEDIDSQGPGGSVNSDADTTTGRTQSVTLTAGQTFVGFDAGAYDPPSILGTIEGDTTGDGNGDTPQSGVTVELLDATGSTVLDTTTTNINGDYSFTGLAPGSYQVRQTTPSGFTAINDVDGGGFTIIGDQSIKIKNDNSLGVGNCASSALR